MKYDPISIMIYVIIIIIIYVVLGIILKFFEYYLMLPIFNDFNEYVLNHSLLLFPRILYAILYSTYLIIFVSAIFAAIIKFLIILYVLRFILLFLIPVFPIPIGVIMYAIIPPFVQFEEAGIFTFIDNIIASVFKSFPSLEKKAQDIIQITTSFTKDKFLDLVKEANPNVELDNSQFGKVFVERFINGNEDSKKSFNEKLKESKEKIKEFIENFEEKPNKNSQFYNSTKKAMSQALDAETYKSYDSTFPNMSYVEIMTTALNNSVNSFKTKAATIGDNVKIETSRTADK